MEKVKSIWVIAVALLAVLGLNVPGQAAEIVYEEDIVQNIVPKDTPGPRRGQCDRAYGCIHFHGRQDEQVQ